MRTPCARTSLGGCRDLFWLGSVSDRGRVTEPSRLKKVTIGRQINIFMSQFYNFWSADSDRDNLHRPSTCAVRSLALSFTLSLSYCLYLSLSRVHVCVYMCSRLGSHGQQCSLFPQVCVYAFHVVSVYDFCAAFPSCIPGGVSNNSLAPCTGRRQVPTLSPYAANVVMGPVFAAPSFRPVLH